MTDLEIEGSAFPRLPRQEQQRALTNAGLWRGLPDDLILLDQPLAGFLEHARVLEIQERHNTIIRFAPALPAALVRPVPALHREA